MSTVKIGWASRDISSDKPVIISGQAYQRVSKGIHDPITTTALVIDDGDVAIMVSCDMVSVTGPQLDMVRDKVAKKNPEIPVMNIFIGATHTHAGTPRTPDANLFKTIDGLEECPVTIEIASSDEYIDFMTSAVADEICEAWDKRAESGVAYGYGYAVVAHSRRVCYFDDLSKRGNVDVTNTFGVNGHAAMYGNTNDDMYSHYEAGADHFINILYTFDKEGKLTGAIINVPCPSQNSEHSEYLSASYWYEVRQLIRAKYGDIFVLPQCACAGDLAPRILHYKKAQERRFALKFGGEETISEEFARKDIAERIAAAFDEVYSWAKKDIRTTMPVVHKVETVELERDSIPEDVYEYCVNGLELARKKPFVATDDHAADFKYNTTLLSDRNRFLAVIKDYNEQKENKKTRPVEVHVIKVGDIAFATNPFELYMDYQHRIQARSPFEQVFMVQLCAQPVAYAGNACYLCTERGKEGKGYSAIPFSCKFSPNGGQQYVEAVVKEMKEIF